MAKRFGLVVLLLAVMVGTGFSQTFTGMFDGYYGYNFNKPGNRTNAIRAFDINDNEFSLSYAELAVEKKPAPVGYRFDLGFGDTARIVNAAEPANVTTTFYQHVQQAYITMGKDKWTVDFGKFVTAAGAEVIETKDNWNYSRGVLFTWAIPFYHFGVRAAVNPTDKVSFGTMVVNGWNNVKDNNSAKTVGFMMTLKPGKLTWVNNYFVGKENVSTRSLYDSIATVALTKEFSVMANYDYGMDRGTPVGKAVVGPRTRWQGIALYAQASPASWFKFTPRWEWFEDPQGFMTGTPEKLKEFTVTGQFINKDSLSLWTEYRRDWATDPIKSVALPVFPKVTNGAPLLSDSQNTLTLGLTYSFSKEVK